MSQILPGKNGVDTLQANTGNVMSNYLKTNGSENSESNIKGDAKKVKKGFQSILENVLPDDSQTDAPSLIEQASALDLQFLFLYNGAAGSSAMSELQMTTANTVSSSTVNTNVNSSTSSVADSIPEQSTSIQTPNQQNTLLPQTEQMPGSATAFTNQGLPAIENSNTEKDGQALLSDNKTSANKASVNKASVNKASTAPFQNPGSSSESWPAVSQQAELSAAYGFQTSDELQTSDKLQTSDGFQAADGFQKSDSLPIPDTSAIQKSTVAERNVTLPETVQQDTASPQKAQQKDIHQEIPVINVLPQSVEPNAAKESNQPVKTAIQEIADDSQEIIQPRLSVMIPNESQPEETEASQEMPSSINIANSSINEASQEITQSNSIATDSSQRKTRQITIQKSGLLQSEDSGIDSEAEGSMNISSQDAEEPDMSRIDNPVMTTEKRLMDSTIAKETDTPVNADHSVQSDNMPAKKTSLYNVTEQQTKRMDVQKAKESATAILKTANEETPTNTESGWKLENSAETTESTSKRASAQIVSSPSAQLDSLELQQQQTVDERRTDRTASNTVTKESMTFPADQLFQKNNIENTIEPIEKQEGETAENIDTIKNEKLSAGLSEKEEKKSSDQSPAEKTLFSTNDLKNAETVKTTSDSFVNMVKQTEAKQGTQEKVPQNIEVNESTLKNFTASPLAETMVKSIQYLQKNRDEDSLVIKLKPEQYGELHIKITQRGSILEADIRTNDSSMQSLLAENVNQLKDNLSRQGISCNQIHISFQTPSQGNPEFQNNQAQEDRTQRNEPGLRINKEGKIIDKAKLLNYYQKDQGRINLLA